MGLASLDAALSGLRTSQQQINVISNNVANVGTEGFTRKILPQSSQAINGVTSGVRPETIIRNVDINLERDLWTQESAVGFNNVQSGFLSRVEAFHGPPDAEISFAAELGRLRDGFSALADAPENTFLQASAVDQAVDTANRINEFSSLITTLRNDAQDQISTSIEQINGLLSQIAELNDTVKGQLSTQRSSAATEDVRSQAINDLASLIEISFFQRGDGVIVVQTNEGVELASDRAERLTFSPTPLSAETAYPNSVSGIFVGDPNTNPGAFDITQRSPGGALGGLLTLRDETFPQQTAQLDELAHKLALRFEAQGLQLFTDGAGNIPPDTAPIPDPPGPLTPVQYVGFSAEIQVNTDVINDNTLLQSGTYGGVLESGSNDVVRRVLDFTFGNIDFQSATGAIDIRTSTNAAPNNTLQNFLGARSENQIEGAVNLTPSNGYNSLSALLTAGGIEAFGAAPNETDSLTITFSDPDFGGSHAVELDLSAIAALPSAGSAAQDIINAINADPDFANAITDFGASVTIGSDGELVINSRGDVNIAASGTQPLSDVGFAFLGLGPGTHEAEDPFFDIGVGNNALTRITIEPSDDETDLLAKLQAVPGLAVTTLDEFGVDDGLLRIRPGDDYNNPSFGGDLRLVGGPFQTDNAGANTAVGAGTIPDNLNIVSSLFGSFSGVPVTDVSPLVNVQYGSETNGSLTQPIPTTSFRSSLLGPNANISTGVIGATGLIDHAQKIITQQAQEQFLLQESSSDEQTLRDILNQQLLDESGVNLDEELGFLIVVQTAYAASARVISAVEELFQELLNAV